MSDHAQLLDDDMVDRALDGYTKTGGSMASALLDAVASKEQLAAAYAAFDGVYDVESFADGTRTDNARAAMRAALAAAIFGPKE